jgi:dynein heavy chain 2
MLKSLAYYQYNGNSQSFLLDVTINELLHIFGDRLVDRKSLLEFQTIVSDVFLQDWNYQFNFKEIIIYKSICSSGFKPILSKISLEECEESIKKELQLYERECRKLDLIMFGELFSVITSIERVLIQPGGSLLLAKRPGIPMLELIQFISSYLKIKVFVPLVLKAFNKKSFYSDLKLAVTGAGVSNEISLLIIDDQHVYDAQVLENINSLLCSGEISDLFSNEDLESIYTTLKDEYSTSGFFGTIHEFFICRLKKNLHIAVVLDVGNETFLSNCQANPALYSQCQMIWKNDWNPYSEKVISNEMLANLRIKEDLKSGLSEKLLSIHRIQKESGASSQFLKEFLLNYLSIFRSIEGRILKRKSYLEGGVIKLQSSFEYVDKLSESAESQRHELIHKQNQADLALREITESLVRAADQKKEIEALTVQLGSEEEKLVVQKQKIERELGDVEPLLRAAQDSVGEIRSESLSEIRSLRAPPTAVRDVLEGVLRLMGILDVSWNSMKVFLGQRTVKEEILNFNARNITKAIR